MTLQDYAHAHTHTHARTHTHTHTIHNYYHECTLRNSGDV